CGQQDIEVFNFVVNIVFKDTSGLLDTCTNCIPTILTLIVEICSIASLDGYPFCNFVTQFSIGNQSIPLILVTAVINRPEGVRGYRITFEYLFTTYEKSITTDVA